MGAITTTDGTEIFFKDWGSGQPIVFSHGWPLSADPVAAKSCATSHATVRAAWQERYSSVQCPADGPDRREPRRPTEELFDDLQAQLAASRSEFYRALPSGPFYGFNRPGVEPSEAIIENWWRQGMMGGAKAHYDGIVACSQTDFTEDLKKISVPVLVMHGGDDQRRPARLAAVLTD